MSVADRSKVNEPKIQQTVVANRCPSEQELDVYQCTSIGVRIRQETNRIVCKCNS